MAHVLYISRLYVADFLVQNSAHNIVMGLFWAEKRGKYLKAGPFNKFWKQNASRILTKKEVWVYLFVILPFVVCLLIRLLPLSLFLRFLSLSSLRLCLLISSKSDASKYSSSCMISNTRPYLREKKIVRRPQNNLEDFC